MKTINYKGKGEHSVRELELITEQQAEELHLLKSGQKQLPTPTIVKSLPHTEYRWVCGKCDFSSLYLDWEWCPMCGNVP